MAAALTREDIAKYQREGYLSPLPALPPGEARELLRRLERLEADEGGRLSAATNKKPHLLLTWLNDLIRDPRILDAVEGVIGPNILCWGTGFFSKDAKAPARVTWHQDSTYWGLSKPDIVTAWIAFTPSTVESGCMRVIPGTHLSDQVPHRDTFAADNLLSRGQEIEVSVDEAKAVDVILQPGEMSLHHVRLIHGSEPNRANHRRIGFAVRYVPTYVEQISGVRDSATLVRGTDAFGNFTLEPTPKRDFDPDTVAFHAKMLEANTEILYRGAEKRPDFNAAAR